MFTELSKCESVLTVTMLEGVSQLVFVSAELSVSLGECGCMCARVWVWVLSEQVHHYRTAFRYHCNLVVK